MKACTSLALLSVVVVACSSSESDPGPKGPGQNTPPPPPLGPMTIDPAQASVLSCGKATFTAKRDGAPVTTAQWIASAGTISGGAFTAPTKGLAAPVMITATDQEQRATAKATIATAFPSAAKAIAGSKGGVAGVFDHAAAAKGKRVYAVWPTKESDATAGISIARSDDGGTTFGAARVAVTTNVSAAATSVVDCVSVAIDATNADVVYVAGHVNADNDIIHAASPPAKDQTTFLLESDDGGGTWKTYPLWSGLVAGGPYGDGPSICPDVMSPAKDTVVVANPGAGDPCGSAPDIGLWVDAKRGTGFETGVVDATNSDFAAKGISHALDRVDGGTACPDSAHIQVLHDAVESPRLFSDANGHMCITYIGAMNGTKPEHTYVQCGNAMSTAFSPQKALDPDDGDRTHASAVGAFGPANHLAVAWVTSNAGADEKLFVAISTNNGDTFGAPIQVPPYPSATMGIRTPSIAYDADGALWIAYAPQDGTTDRLVVDKTCDDGMTWSGAILANGTESAIVKARYPALVATDGAPALVSHVETSLQTTTLAAQ